MLPYKEDVRGLEQAGKPITASVATGAFAVTRPISSARGATAALPNWLFPAACAGALLLVFAAYSNSFDNSFHFDDSHVIQENLFIRDIRNIPRFFTDARTFSSLPSNSNYRPIVSTTLALDYWLARGLMPRQFHITQFLLFILTGAMLVALFFRILQASVPSSWNRWIALLAATFFGVHAGNTQTLNYISARSELLAGIGVLGAVSIYAYSPRLRRRQLHLLPMILGTLAKTPAIIVAPLLLAYGLLIEQQLSVREIFSRKAWPRTQPVLLSTAPAFVLAVALFAIVEGMNPPGQTYGGMGRLEYLMTQGWVWVHYMRLFLLPTVLSADTDLEHITRLSDPRLIVGVLVAGLLTLLVWNASTRRTTRPAAFGIAWFAIALLPSSSIFPLAEVANDHRIFFPFMGLSLALISAVAMWLENRAPTRAWPHAVTVNVAVAAIAVVLAAHAVGAFRRNRVWRSEGTLWADVARKSPRNGRGLMNYGLTLMGGGDYAKAKEIFLQAHLLTPRYPTLEINLGIVEGALANQEAAEAHFTTALTLAPNDNVAHRLYASWLVKQGRASEAIVHLQRALALSAADGSARHLLMTLFAAEGDTSLLALARETLAIDSADSMAAAYARGDVPLGPDAPSYAKWVDLGLQFTRQGRHAEAAQAYRAALAFNSTSADAWNNLGWSLAKLGFYDVSIPAFRNTLRLQPGYTLAANNLAWAAKEVPTQSFKRGFALQQTGRDAEAVAIYRRLIPESPRWVNAHYNLGYALMKLGSYHEAAREFERTIDLKPDFAEARLHLASCNVALGVNDSRGAANPKASAK